MKYQLIVFSFLFLFNSNIYSQVPAMTENTSTVMGMVLLPEMKLMDYENIEKGILNTWDIQKEDIDGNDQTISFKVDSTTFMIAMIPAPVPGDELENAVEYCYLWKDARSALNNKSHIIIAVVGENSKLDLYKKYTKMAAIILKHSDATGIYMGGQTLVLSKDFFIKNADSMDGNKLPLFNWIYFGKKQSDKGNSVYTYGLKEFGLEELEIVDSKKTMEEILGFIYDIAHYTISGNIILNDGETVGGTEEEKIKISYSNGVHLDGKTLKIGY
ncbi:MAG TPA: DUF4261 domain-containing protein [Bacteroidetes bacterium]|nr:DUF4261 domain-containing protein [Bacteroidota bacterium]